MSEQPTESKHDSSTTSQSRRPVGEEVQRVGDFSEQLEELTATTKQLIDGAVERQSVEDFNHVCTNYAAAVGDAIGNEIARRYHELYDDPKAVEQFRNEYEGRFLPPEVSRIQPFVSPKTGDRSDPSDFYPPKARHKARKEDR